MASSGRRNQGKTEFVKEVLSRDVYANATVVNDAWQASGRDGTISETLVNKMRSELGLTGNLRGGRPKGHAAEPAAKPKYTGKKRGRKPKSEMPAITAASGNGKPVAEPRASRGPAPVN